MTRAHWVVIGIVAGVGVAVGLAGPGLETRVLAAIVVLLVATIGLLLRRLERASAALAASLDHDALTHLPNRRLLTDRLAMAIAQAKRSGAHGALLFIDLDHFKRVNDSHGHAVGDLLLLGVAERLGREVRQSDTVARIGGDEFVVLFPSLDVDPGRARVVAEGLATKLLDRLAAAHHLPIRDPDGVATTVAHQSPGSIGIALFDGGSEAADTMQAADRAMYRAKAHGRNRFALAER